jgi:hypothetical protein
VGHWMGDGLIEEYPGRFVIGSDAVGFFDEYKPTLQRYYLLLDALRPATAQRVTHDNFLALLPAHLTGAVRPRIRAPRPRQEGILDASRLISLSERCGAENHSGNVASLNDGSAQPTIAARQLEMASSSGRHTFAVIGYLCCERHRSSQHRGSGWYLPLRTNDSAPHRSRSEGRSVPTSSLLSAMIER